MAVESGKTAKNYSQGEITMKKCTEFVFDTTVDSETKMSSIVTEVSYTLDNKYYHILKSYLFENTHNSYFLH